MRWRLYNLACCYVAVFGVFVCCGVYTIGVHERPMPLHVRGEVTTGD